MFLTMYNAIITPRARDTHTHISHALCLGVSSHYKLIVSTHLPTGSLGRHIPRSQPRAITMECVALFRCCRGQEVHNAAGRFRSVSKVSQPATWTPLQPRSPNWIPQDALFPIPSLALHFIPLAARSRRSYRRLQYHNPLKYSSHSEGVDFIRLFTSGQGSC